MTEGGGAAHRLPVAPLAVQNDDTARITHNPHALVGYQTATESAPQIPWQHADAVGIVTGEVGLDKVGCDGCCLLLVAASVPEQLRVCGVGREVCVNFIY